MRHHGRLEWWRSDATTIRDCVHIAREWSLYDADGEPIDELPPTPIPDGGARPYTDDVPVIFGHYWFNGSPRVTGPTTGCVDYSAVNGNPLVAYRWSGESTLDDASFVSS